MISRNFTTYITAFAFILVLLSLSGCFQLEEPTVEIDVDAKSAVIMDMESGEVLYEKDADKRYPPASTTKIMTAVVAIESLPLDTEITPTKKGIYVEPTVAGLRQGVRYKLEDLISAILIKSANDAAKVIAISISGSEEEFARLMNKKAEEIGMTDTYFLTASGLPTGKKDKQYTTAKDLATLMRYASRYDVIMENVSQKTANIYGSDGRKIYLKTHNKALLRSDNAPWGKTGYTREARRTFAGCDPSYEPSICFGLLKSDDLWDDITTLKDKGLELHELSNRTFFSKLMEWIRYERVLGKEEAHLLLNNKK
ncbi:D-alanyl-D-alanine carboxypeptidase family protein [Candidatus Omnitrophota bacterium]